MYKEGLALTNISDWYTIKPNPSKPEFYLLVHAWIQISTALTSRYFCHLSSPLSFFLNGSVHYKLDPV